MILYAAADLLWATRIKETCVSLGIAARPVRTLEMLGARLADSPVRGLIVDLETGDLGLELIRRARAAGSARPGLAVVAFGPHVAADLFAAARAAGADRVLARGAFSDRLPELLRALSEPGPPDAPEGSIAPG
ncbi:MAG TPA: hypothetical protein VFF69_11585 [Phycisphaerales bacterium]|nr:hypothetical protein [Phycisphaerales bacterium]